MTDTNDPDKYESDETPIASLDTLAHKFYQILVPKFELVGDTKKPGNSFLRLGSFPTGAPGTSDPDPAEFKPSRDLANLVGEAGQIAVKESNDLEPSKDDPSYKGDPNYLLGFADDTRFRTGATPPNTLVNGAVVSNTTANRQKETKTLLTKGGWWDHSDGNRISTTAGDKIEIIQGNYKMLVLGRQALPTVDAGSTIAGNTHIRDNSGGHVMENGPSPTHCIKSIEFVQTGETWEVYQNNGIGRVYSSFYGDVVDVFMGTNQSTWSGRAPSDFKPSDSDVNPAFKVYQKSEKLHPVSPTADSSPVISAHTWADKIVEYKRIKKSISSDVEAESIKERTVTSGKIESYTKGLQIASDNIAATITTTQTAATITNVNTAANTFNFTFGIQETINIGAILNASLGAIANITGPITLNLGMDDWTWNNFENVGAAQRTAVTGIDTRITNLETDISNFRDAVGVRHNFVCRVLTQVGQEFTTVQGSLALLGQAVNIGW